MSWFITVCRPETGAVRCKHFITDDYVAFFIETKFKFCISNNDSFAQCVFCTFFIECDCAVTKFFCIFLTFAREIFFQMSNALFKGDVFIVITDFRFCRWSINRFRQFVGFFQTFRQLDSTYFTGFFIAFPTTSCNVTTYNTFDWKHFQFAAHHAVSIKFFLLEKFRHIFYIYGNHMVWQNIFCQIKPEF